MARSIGRGDAVPLEDIDIASLATKLGIRELEPGATVWEAGEPSPGVCVVRSGSLELSVRTGRERAVLQILRRGEVNGDIELLLGVAMPYTARAIGPTRCLMIDAAAFEQLLAERPALARRWLWSIASRLSHSHRRLVGLLGRSLAEQVSSLLIAESVDGQIALPQRTIAAMLGARRPSLNKVLKNLERAGLIRLSYSLIEVLDPTGLERFSGGTST